MRVSKSRMHTIIRVKTHQEKKAQQELVKIQDKKEKETSVLTHLEQSHQSAANEAARTSKARAAEVQTNRAFLQNLSRQIQQQHKKVGDIRVEEDEKRDELLAKSKSKKMVEKLDAKRRAESMKESERKEQSVIDGLARRVRRGSRI